MAKSHCLSSQCPNLGPGGCWDGQADGHMHRFPQGPCVLQDFDLLRGQGPKRENRFARAAMKRLIGNLGLVDLKLQLVGKIRKFACSFTRVFFSALMSTIQHLLLLLSLRDLTMGMFQIVHGVTLQRRLMMCGSTLMVFSC